jgi:hypothetical protein
VHEPDSSMGHRPTMSLYESTGASSPPPQMSQYGDSTSATHGAFASPRLYVCCFSCSVSSNPDDCVRTFRTRMMHQHGPPVETPHHLEPEHTTLSRRPCIHRAWTLRIMGVPTICSLAHPAVRYRTAVKVGTHQQVDTRASPRSKPQDGDRRLSQTHGTVS